MELPVTACRRCGKPPADCQCPGEPGVTIIVPDGRAWAIREYLREHPKLQKDEYDTGDRDPLLGLCYPAAEAYYHALDCEPDVYCLSWSDVDDDYDGTHWYLREPDDGRFIDLGLPESPLDGVPPFEAGTRRGFTTGDPPSNRAQQVLEALDVA